MKTLKKLMMCALLALATTAVFSGCRTAHGFGEDMESAGEHIQDKTTK
jgi:predicted small secreted protein